MSMFMKHSLYPRHSFTRLFLTGLLLILLTVSLTPFSNAYAEETFAGIEKEFIPRSNRDPFVPIIAPPTAVETAPAGTSALSETAPKKPETAQQPVAPAIPAKEQYEQLNVVITGMLQTPTGTKAIIKTADGNSYILALGDRLDGWRVSRITDSQVYFTKNNSKAKASLQTDK